MPTDLIAFTGRKGSGKDTAADVLVASGYARVRMADGLKIMLRALLRYRGVPDAMIERFIEGDLKETPCPALNGATPRHAMQTLGTEWGRNCIHPDLWADATADRIRQHELAVVTDVRFHNEAEMIDRLGGDLYRVEREGVAQDSHASETEITSLPVLDVLENNHPTKEAFQAYVRAGSMFESFIDDMLWCLFRLKHIGVRGARVVRVSSLLGQYLSANRRFGGHDGKTYLCFGLRRKGFNFEVLCVEVAYV